MIDWDKFWIYRVTGISSFLSLIVMINAERIGIWFLYRYLNLSVHNRLIQNLIWFFVVIFGLLCFCLSSIPSLQGKTTEAQIFLVLSYFVVGFILRWFTVKTNFYYFQLDDDFYRDKNGNDIRKSEGYSEPTPIQFFPSWKLAKSLASNLLIWVGLLCVLGILATVVFLSFK